MAVQFFIRRGTIVQGPLEKPRLLAALNSGKLLLTDEYAVAREGPWHRVAELTRGSAAEIPLIEEFTVRKSLLAGHFVASYECPRCHAQLQSDETEWKRIEACPTCGKRYRISPEAVRQAASERHRLVMEKAEREAAAARARALKDAARQAAVARKADAERATALLADQQSAARQAAESRAVHAAAAARLRPGACWYCGGPLPAGWIQCFFCRMITTH